MKIDNIEDKIVLYIKYDKPIELRNFSIGLDCFQRLYTNITKYNNNSSHLTIQEIEKGSILIDFVVNCTPYIPLFKNSIFFIQSLNSISEFIKNITQKPKEQIYEELNNDKIKTKQNINDFKGFISINNFYNNGSIIINNNSNKEEFFIDNKDDYKEGLTFLDEKEIGEILATREYEKIFTINNSVLKFKDNCNCNLSDGSTNIWIKIVDKDFLNNVKNGSISFSNKDMLKCKIIEKQYKDMFGLLTTEYEAIEIIKH